MVGDTHLNIGESSQIRTKVESGGLNLDGKTYRPHDLTKSSFLCCLLLFVWVIFNYETLPRFYDQNNAYCISQITGVLVFVWIVFVQLFLYTEPGIIPKDVYFETFKRLNDKELQSTSKLSLTSLDHKRIYCSICNIHRPKNVLHCIICQVCVVSHDHHCSLLGSCVGKRNYYLFVCQLFTGASLATIMSVCAWYIIWDGLNYTATHMSYCHIIFVTLPFTSVVAIICTLCGAGMVPLHLLHCFLISINNTTRQYFHRYYIRTHKEHFSIFNYVKNLWKLMTRRTPPSLLYINFLSDEKVAEIVSH